MGDGPVANLPAGLDAYAGYVDDGGDGITFPGVVAKFPNSLHLSISVHGSPAQMADVETGALSSWVGYDYGYAAVSRVGTLIQQFGRPKKLCVAHYSNISHICSSATCWPFSPVPWVADGTQWTTHNNTFDEWLLEANFFDLTMPQPVPTGGTVYPSGKLNQPILSVYDRPNHPGQGWRFAADGGVFPFGGAPMFGNPTGTVLAAPIVGAAVAENGYTMIGSDGGSFPYGPEAPNVPSLAP